MRVIINNKALKSIVMAGLCALSQFAQSGELPCGPEAVFDYVGKGLNPPLSGRALFDSMFSPVSVDTKAGEFKDLSAARFTNRRNEKCAAGVCDTYFSYGAFTEALKFARGNFDKDGTIAKFACIGTLTDRIRETGEFFAHVAQETSVGTPSVAAGLAYGFGANDECYQKDPSIAQGVGSCVRYDYSETIDKETGKLISYINYHGRGPHQLTYKGNYLWFGEILKGPKYADDYLNNPDLLIDNATTGWASAIAFQMLNYTEKGTTYTKPALHQLVNQSLFDASTWKGSHGEWGFGNTINSINGGVECTSTTINGEPMNRINNYIEFLIRMGVNVQSVSLSDDSGQTAVRSLQQLQAGILKPWKPNQYHEVLYLSQPIPDVYYSQWVAGTERYFTHLKKVVLTYLDGDQARQERLDCTGYKTFNLAP